MPRLDTLFTQLQARGASDLHIAAGYPIKMRIHGQLEVIYPQSMTPEGCAELLREIVSEDQWDTFHTHRDLDFAYGIEGVVRVRASYLMTAQGPAAVFRSIPEEILSAEALGLSRTILDLAMAERGLVLVTGPTGSGKSTTMAAMIDHINAHRTRNIILLEDPTEFVHPDKRSFIVQREIGTHARSFARALRAAVREDPDVILVGEMRDEETVALALEAAEMGFLVFGTLHTNSAVKTVDRIVDTFPTPRQPAARLSLSNSLRGVISQLLLRRVGGKGRVAVHEVLVATAAISNMIRAGETTRIASALQTGQSHGMQTMDQALMKAFKGGLIDGDTAFAKASDKGLFGRFVTAESAGR